MPEGQPVRLRGKCEVLYASPEFCWALFGKGAYGKEGKWALENEPRFAFRRLVEKLMPGYFDVLSCRYGVDNLLAECHHILDLAFVAANWRYTMIVNKKYYRCGLAVWHPADSKWNMESTITSGGQPAAAIADAPATTSASSQVSPPSQVSASSGGSRGDGAHTADLVPAPAEADLGAVPMAAAALRQPQ
jgi:hypothetical protein